MRGPGSGGEHRYSADSNGETVEAGVTSMHYTNQTSIIGGEQQQ